MNKCHRFVKHSGEHRQANKQTGRRACKKKISNLLLLVNRDGMRLTRVINLLNGIRNGQLLPLNRHQRYFENCLNHFSVGFSVLRKEKSQNF